MEPRAERGGFGRSRHQDDRRTVHPSRAPPVPSEPAHVRRDETEASSGIFPIRKCMDQAGDRGARP